MASKRCPSCKLVNPASSTMCDCGYPFADSIAPSDLTRGDTKRCPLCLRFHSTTTATCTCGFDLSMSTDELRVTTKSQHTHAAIGIALGACLVNLGIAIAILTSVLNLPVIMPVGLIAVGGTWLGRSLRQRARCRKIMQSFKFAELPTAKLIDR